MRAPEKSRRIVRERMYSEALLTASGESAQSIAIRLGITPRTVVRYRARRRTEVRS
jgi:DNA-binding CsgD family transcriptional regulator